MIEQEILKLLQKHQLAGVRYNVIKRSAHKGSAPKKDGTRSKSAAESMIESLEDDIAHGRVNEWFSRWKIEVTNDDVEKFKRESLDPILEQLCSWWEVIGLGKDPFDHAWRSAAIHWRHPYGIYNPVLEGGFGEIDTYLQTGSKSGLQQVDVLFPELAD